MFSFNLHHQDQRARSGELRTPHGSVETPVFMPVGTRGSVKGILPDQLRRLGASMLLANTYHLMLRPGPDIVESLGGLHRFMAWDGPILTDSGGYQVFSLNSLNRVTQDSVEFASHIDGAACMLSPEIAVRVQQQLGADIIMAFDECVALPADRPTLQAAVERTVRWAGLCLNAWDNPDQWLFGIVQGGTDLELRRQCSNDLTSLDFPGYAIGGLSVGEGHDDMIATVDHSIDCLPADKPRYLMGVGTPRDIVAAIACGIDMFDCVMPTRNGRNAFVFTRQGTLRLRNQCYKEDTRPLDPDCDCLACQQFTRGYIRHLFLVNEMAGPVLVSLHNLAFYQTMMRDARRAIREQRFAAWSRPWLTYGLQESSECLNLERT